MSLLPNPEFDRPGFCALCHIPIAEFDGPRLVRIMSKARPMYVRLNDGSMMSVTVCKDCKDKFTDADVPVLMESIYKGWVASIEKGGWSKEALDEHAEVYGSKYIVECDERGVSKQTLKDAKLDRMSANKINDLKVKEIALDVNDI